VDTLNRLASLAFNRLHADDPEGFFEACERVRKREEALSYELEETRRLLEMLLLAANQFKTEKPREEPSKSGSPRERSPGRGRAGRLSQPRQDILRTMEQRPEGYWSPEAVWEDWGGAGPRPYLSAIQNNMVRMFHDGQIGRKAKGMYLLQGGSRRGND
jgi:hypothetical protein